MSRLKCWCQYEGENVGVCPCSCHDDEHLLRQQTEAAERAWREAVLAPSPVLEMLRKRNQDREVEISLLYGNMRNYNLMLQHKTST